MHLNVRIAVLPEALFAAVVLFVDPKRTSGHENTFDTKVRSSIKKNFVEMSSVRLTDSR